MIIAFLLNSGGGAEVVTHNDMGPDWNHDNKCLITFARELSKQSGRKVNPGIGPAGKKGRFKEEDWNKALDMVQDCYQED